MKTQLDRFKIRELIAESGKMRVNDIMAYLKYKYNDQYDVKVARQEAKEMVAEMKAYM